MKARMTIVCLCLCIAALFLWKETAEPRAYAAPGYEKQDIAPLLEKESLEEEDYRFLFMQTGLGPKAVDSLLEQGKKDRIIQIWHMYFTVPDLLCTKNSPISWEEEIAPEQAERYSGRLAALENGDILITPCSHTFGWRNGHAAIVVDAMQGLTVESTVLGRPSELQTLSKWEKYPAVIVLRLKDAGKELRSEIAEYTAEHMQGIPYGFREEILEHILGAKGRDTHCSHLVWEVFRHFGYDLDSDGGIAVTPRDIAESPLLEVIQVYGIRQGQRY